jgi:hypothetical protein
VHRDDRPSADEDVHLDRLGLAPPVEASAEEDEQHVIAVVVQLRSLAETPGVLERERVESE